MPGDEETSTDLYIPEPVPEAGGDLPADEDPGPSTTGASDASAAYEPQTPPDEHVDEPASAAPNGASSPAPAEPVTDTMTSEAPNGTESAAAPRTPANGADGATGGSANGKPPNREVNEPTPSGPPAATPPSRVIVTLRRSPDPSFDLDLLKRLNAAVTANEGPTPLHLHVVKTDGSTARLRWPKTIQPDEALLGELSAQFGKDCVSVA